MGFFGGLLKGYNEARARARELEFREEQASLERLHDTQEREKDRAFQATRDAFGRIGDYFQDRARHRQRMQELAEGERLGYETWVKQQEWKRDHPDPSDPAEIVYPHAPGTVGHLWQQYRVALGGSPLQPDTDAGNEFLAIAGSGLSYDEATSQKDEWSSKRVSQARSLVAELRKADNMIRGAREGTAMTEGGLDPYESGADYLLRRATKLSQYAPLVGDPVKRGQYLEDLQFRALSGEITDDDVKKEQSALEEAGQFWGRIGYTNLGELGTAIDRIERAERLLEQQFDEPTSDSAAQDIGRAMLPADAEPQPTPQDPLDLQVAQARDAGAFTTPEAAEFNLETLNATIERAMREPDNLTAEQFAFLESMLPVYPHLVVPAMQALRQHMIQKQEKMLREHMQGQLNLYGAHPNLTDAYWGSVGQLPHGLPLAPEVFGPPSDPYGVRSAREGDDIRRRFEEFYRVKR